MEQLTANLSGATRRATLNGREHIVAPLSLIVPGVLNGSKGPLYYPQEEIARSAKLWNHVPIVVYHPLVDGQHVSARDPDVLNAQGIGVILRAAANGKLTAEGWFDVEQTRKIDNRILEALEAGKPIELSTGLFTDNEIAPDGSAYEDKPYSFVARNYRPDHLAILPDQVGACSVKDGCGVLVNQSKLLRKIGELLGVTNVTKTEGTEQLPASAYAYVPDSNKPSTWKLRIDDAAHVGGAIAAIGKGFRGRKAQIPAADLPGVKAKIRAAWLKVHPDKSKADLPTILRNEESEMADELGANERKKIVDGLIANSCCWKGEDRETLNGLSDDKLKELQTHAEKEKRREVVANAARKGFEDKDGTTHNFDEEKGEWQSKPKKPEPTTNTTATADKKDDPPAKPQTAEEWLKAQQAPPEIQGAVRNAIDIEAREKARLIEQLTSNVTDEGEKKKLVEQLQSSSLEALRNLAVLAPEPKEDPVATASYFGAAAPAANRAAVVDKEDILPLPVINWAEEQKARQAQQQA